MKISNKFKPELAIEIDGLRFPHPFLDAAKRKLISTNGYIMSVFSVDTEKDEKNGNVRVETLKPARKIEGKSGTSTLSTVEPDTCVPNNWEDLLSHVKRGDEDTITFSFNPSLLIALAKSMASENSITLTVKIPKKNKDMLEGILVEPLEANGAVGVLMPMRGK